jgi:hypothetical protein
MLMMTLAKLSVLDFGKKKKILGDNVVIPRIYGGLILLPREIRVIPPPWIICPKIWLTGRLLIVVESVCLFHLSKKLSSMDNSVLGAWD